jgi:hypothetical protein
VCAQLVPSCALTAWNCPIIFPTWKYSSIQVGKIPGSFDTEASVALHFAWVERQHGSIRGARERECVSLASDTGDPLMHCRGEHQMGADEPFSGLVLVIAIGIAIVVGLILVSVVF